MLIRFTPKSKRDYQKMLVNLPLRFLEAKMSESTARNILKLRRLSGMTQDDFARIADVSRGAVAQWEGGRAEPRMGSIQRLSDYFHVPKAWIIEDDGMDGVRMVSGVAAFQEAHRRVLP
jgi:transcriptional regulator with XRE-family HTH domain